MRFTDTKFETYKIADLSNVITGGTPSTKNSNYWNGDIRWMPSGDIHKKYIFDVSKRITKEGLNNSSTKLIPPKSILVALAGQGKTRGTSAISEIETCINQSIAAILPSQRFNSYYLFHLLESKYEDLRLISSGDGGRGGLNKELILNYKCSIPSYEEQYKVAIFLNTIDQRIDTQIKIIEAYQSLIKGICTKLITSKAGNTKIENCLYCNTSNLKESELDEINSGNYPVYGANGYIKSINNYQTDEDSIGIIKDGAGVGRMMKLKGKYSILATLNFLTARKGYNIDYIYYALKNKSFKKLIVGSGIPHIYFKDYKHDSIYIPDNNDEITAIVKILNTYDTIIINEKSLLLLLEQLKAYLLKNMFI